VGCCTWAGPLAEFAVTNAPPDPRKSAQEKNPAQGKKPILAYFCIHGMGVFSACKGLFFFLFVSGFSLYFLMF
jgi:hypothetical protein